MKNNEYSVYATNKGGYIKSPKGKIKDEPKTSVIKSSQDLRSKSKKV